MVAAAIRTIFEQPDETMALEQLRRLADGLAGRFPAVTDLLLEAEPDLLIHFTFPELHRARIRSTNPQERLNKEIQTPHRRCRHLSQSIERAAPRRHGARRAGRRIAGRTTLLPSRLDSVARRGPARGGGPSAVDGELINGRGDSALLHDEPGFNHNGSVRFPEAP
jgi:Transposase, Mutator family